MGKSDAASSGLILLHKQPGMTSFEALGEVKRVLGTNKAGHTGTLDKFAEGLLVVLTGRALKLSPWFSHCDKQYEGTIHFGLETDTLDPEGEPIAKAVPPSREAIEHILPQFTGAISQAPPAYSAIHINGKRASALARSGEIPEMQKRLVHIYKLELRSWEAPFARIFVHCSSGTYIRSLARDIALAAGSRAYLSALMRTRVAGFRLEDVIRDSYFPRPIAKAVFNALGLPCIEIDPYDVEKVIHGKALAPIIGKMDISNSAAGLFCGNSFIAMIKKLNGSWKYGYVYARN